MIALDTNVFLYYFQRADERKYQVARGIIERALMPGGGVISYQVVQETLNVMTTKLTPAPAATDIEAVLNEALLPLLKVMPSGALYRGALAIQRRYQLHFYDALVVAGALEAGCDLLLSEDLQHGQVYDGLLVENPFR